MGFRKFVHARHQELRRYHKQHHRRDREKLPQVNFHAAFEESHAQRHGERQAQHSTHEVQQLAGAQGDRGEEQHRLRALPEHHEKNEEKKAERGAAAG